MNGNGIKKNIHKRYTVAHITPILSGLLINKQWLNLSLAKK
jgi:hypothetical protein